MELNHPIISKRWDLGGRTKRRKALRQRADGLEESDGDGEGDGKGDTNNDMYLILRQEKVERKEEDWEGSAFKAEADNNDNEPEGK